MSIAILTLTRFPDIFASLARSAEQYEPDTFKIAVTSGDAWVGVRGWIAIYGEEPFVFARNINIGWKLLSASTDVLVINDDCVLVEPLMDTLQNICSNDPSIGILAPQIIGGVGNTAQVPTYSTESVYESPDRIPFVCVYIPAKTRRLVGLMDERFTGYGGDDNDYSIRTRRAGLRLCVTSLVKVRHGGQWTASNSFRRLYSSDDLLISQNSMLQLLKEKYENRI